MDRLERLIDLHAGVVRGDREALEQVAGQLAFSLRRRLRKSFSRASPDLLAEAAHDAILEYAARPLKFDIARGVPLETYLHGIAKRILRDRLRSYTRRSARDNDYAAFIQQAYRHRMDDHATVSTRMREVRAALPRVCNAAELKAIMAWLAEDDSRAVAVNLGLSHLSRAEGEREVKRFWARVIKRLQRCFGAPTRPGTARSKKN